MYTKGATFLHLLIGPCAAGKSTVADKYRDIPGMVISTDELRKRAIADYQSRTPRPERDVLYC